MPKVQLTELVEAGAHFGHLTRRWNPKMKPFIFMEKNGIHIIDLRKTVDSIDATAAALTNIVAQNKRILFVGTKKQAKNAIAAEARRSDSNWVSERWLGGMLTNFQTIRKSIKRMQTIEKMESDGTFEKITKKERLIFSREKDKLRSVLDGVETLQKLPGALFVVDIKKESIAVKEAHRLNIPVFAIVDTNCDPDEVDYVIPANDDATRAIEIIVRVMSDAIIEGQAKAKELMAEEAAERERNAKEEETEGGDENSRQPRKKPVRFKDRKDRRGNFSKRPGEEQVEETTDNTEAPETEKTTEE
jgi:small subunit ribosomal protein S2